MTDVVLPRRFRLVRPLGEGGMGVVYEAIDEERGARVALKTVRSLTGESLARFKHEFRALIDMHHPNLVMLGELISEGAQWFFTMELVEGEEFLTYVRPTAEPNLGEARTLTPSQATEDALARISLSTSRSERAHPGIVDEARLRAVLPQVASGIAALHRAGMVHRDIKPPNIRVTPQGRAVLLDFGLVIEVDGAPISQRGALSGTPEYMAPEQVSAESVGPAVDWYALGVLLYEALTGRLPFEGTPLEIVMKKVRYEPPPPSSIARGVPPDLDALAVGLLRYDAAARLTGDQVLAALGVETTIAGSRSSGGGLPFVGRDEQEVLLRDAYLASRGKPVSVLVDGESGVGKSCLVRHFVDTLRAGDASAVVLHGRCFERESVPYRGFDGVVDALANFLAHERKLAERLAGSGLSPLLQIFPVLRRVDALAQAASGPMPAVDPVEIRRLAFVSLRELLARLSEERPTVVTLDDLQWADANGRALLAEIMRPEGSAGDRAPQLLVVATMRPTAPSDTQRLKEVAAEIPGEVRRLTLGPLDARAAHELATKLLARSAPGASDAEVIAREASGHPLFIDALVQHAALHLGQGPGRLDDALWFRVSSLEPLARELVQMLAVSSAPMPQHVLASAAEAAPEAFAKSVSLLRVAHLVLTTGAKNADTIEAYHDRLRAAVVLHIDPGTRQARHRALARAFERAEGRAPEALALHWEGAGDPDRAARYLIASADAATSALAFDRAASLYERALRLRSYVDAERRSLYERLGDALANVGRGWPSASAYTEAARGAPPAQALELRRRAADQLLRAGHIEAGLAAVRGLLLATGLGYPRTPFAALLEFVLIRVWLRIRGLRFTRRDATRVTQAELTRIDICGSVAVSLSAVDTVRAATFQARHLLLSLRAGEPVRVTRALGSEAGYLSRAGTRAWPRVAALDRQAMALADETGDPKVTGWVLGAAGLAHYMHGRYVVALERADRAIELLRSRATGAAFEITFAESVALWSLAQLGRVSELGRRQRAYLRAARERGDVYGVVNLAAGDSALAWLAEDDVESARKETDLAMGQWPSHEFLVEHFFELVARTHVDLYAGKAREAHDRIVARWPALQRSLIPLTVHWVRIQAWHFRARACLAVALEERGGAKEALLARAAKDARKMIRENTPQGTPMARTLLAAVAAQRGDGQRAAALLREAITGYEATEMALYAAVSRRALGRLLGGDEGRALVAAAEERIAAEKVKDPRRMSATLAPGFPDDTLF